MINRAYAVLTGLVCLLFASGAFADQPFPWQMGMQPAASPIMHEIRWFEQYTLWFIVPITLFVLLLLIVVVVKFRASANPVPSRTSHNTAIEVVWTVGPVLILLFLAIPSFNLLTAQLTLPQNPDLTLKATATQWQWNYEYTGEKPLAFDSYLLKDDDRAAAGKEDKAVYPRLLAVDNEMVLPVNKVVRLLVTAAPTDVIHAFAMPSFGVKIDAVPGRLNETWFKAEREGLFYGQCSELCGKDHAFMPIAIRVVSQEKYDAWMAAAATNLQEANKTLMAATDLKKTVDVAANAE
ncbi:MAG: cytochrome c oxidase subunit II [Rhizobiales bacterium 63-7]|uniref:cytochrome c oxidase subunit II n=1 Tax=Rhizobium sp. YJ-22 TaxID=3037556 RepID=UPI00092C768F|nr:cytochrome c oxidase subunit II [Rhizobium sp. YJ-22]MBN9029151.1 cytochrome c oxidase subunit II [Hyphomicrobiales bacterium]MDG3574978.1 cytochrome c oxidase subunit II [Rhizobium sp. YJ-22]OJU68275.1 MAG: cytochrome c oxidase subunit II [Rhizobiales bacterium 63-7]